MTSVLNIEENLKEVHHNIAQACQRAHRSIDEVTLISVSKTKPVELLCDAVSAGERNFGENKPQELKAKYEDERLPQDLKWHMIGHLQRNKIRYIIDKVTMIHSVDSVRLAEAISEEAIKRELVIPVLVEVNMAGEESKFGLAPEETESFIRQISVLKGIAVKGLMTIAPYTTDPETNRPYFRGLRELSIDIAGKSIDNIDMCALSMGMTGDYEVAIEEGATLVRVGTGIFGERHYNVEG